MTNSCDHPPRKREVKTIRIAVVSTVESETEGIIDTEDEIQEYDTWKCRECGKIKHPEEPGMV